MAGVGGAVCGKCRQLYLNNNKIIKKKEEACTLADPHAKDKPTGYLHSALKREKHESPSQ